MLLAYFEVDAGQPFSHHFGCKRIVITLLEPFKCPGSDDLLNPSLSVTVPAHIYH